MTLHFKRADRVIWRTLRLHPAWVAVGIALAAHAAIALAFMAIGRRISGTVEYAAIASNLAAGRGFVLHPGGVPILWRPPLYIWYLALFHRLCEHPYRAIVASQILMNAATTGLTFVIGARCFHRRAAFLGAAALAVYPVFTINCLRLMPETLFALLMAGMAVLLLRWIEDGDRRWRTVLGLGVLLGAASLTKASVQFFPLFLLPWAAWRLRGRQSVKAVVGRVTVMLAVMLAVLAPWTVRNYLVAGEFILVDTSGGYTVWVGNRIASRGLDDDPLTRSEREDMKRALARVLGVAYTDEFRISDTAWASGHASSRLYGEALRGLADNPFGTARLWLRKLGRFWFSYIGAGRGVQEMVAVLQGVLLPLFLLGVVRVWRQRKRPAPVFALLTYFPLLHMASTANVRYTVPILPYVLLVAACGTLGLLPRARAERTPRTEKVQRGTMD